LVARLKEFPDRDSSDTTAKKTVFNIEVCTINASTIKDFTVSNLASAQLSGVFEPFTVSHADCTLEYSIVPVSFNSAATTDSVIQSIDLTRN
jgi:hypothetical protein